jgi:hypothetical protein
LTSPEVEASTIPIVQIGDTFPRPHCCDLLDLRHIESVRPA